MPEMYLKWKIQIDNDGMRKTRHRKGALNFDCPNTRILWAFSEFASYEDISTIFVWKACSIHRYVQATEENQCHEVQKFGSPYRKS
jgi:hypothetical protein